MTTDVSFRIVQAVQEFSTEGGVETVAFELAKAWDRAGVPNSVLASAGGGGKVQRVAPWLARIPTRGALRHIGRFLVVPLFTLAVTLALRKHRGAVIVSHGDSLTGDVLVVHAVNAVSLGEKRARRQLAVAAEPDPPLGRLARPLYDRRAALPALCGGFAKGRGRT